MAEDISIEAFANQQYRLLMSADQAALLMAILAQWLEDYGENDPDLAASAREMTIERVR